MSLSNLEVGVTKCTRLVHRATVLLRVSTVVAFCAALIGGGAVGAKAEITASVPAGVHWRASPEGMPLWGPNRFWPGSGLVLRCLGPGFTVLALGPGFRPIIIIIINRQKACHPVFTFFVLGHLFFYNITGIKVEK